MNHSYRMISFAAAVAVASTGCLPSIEIQECYGNRDCVTGQACFAGRCVADTSMDATVIVDATPPDQGSADGGQLDAGATDATSSDTNVPDAASLDAGGADAMVTDRGPGPDGGPCLPTAGRLIRPYASHWAEDLALAWGDEIDRYGVLMQIDQGGNRSAVAFNLFSSTGTPTRPEIVFTASTTEGLAPHIAWNSARQEFGMVWRQTEFPQGVLLATVDAASAVIQAPRLVSDSIAHGVPWDLVFTGTEYGLLYEDDPANSLHFRAEAGDGSAHVTARIDYGVGAFPSMSYAAARNEYVIAHPQWFSDSHQVIAARRLPDSGRRLTPQVELTSAMTVTEDPSVAAFDSGFAVAWVDGRNGGAALRNTLWFRTYDAAGLPLSVERALTSTPTAARPSLIYNDELDEFAVAWEDRRDGDSKIYFRRLATDGMPIGPERLAPDQHVFQSARPRLAWGYAEYGLAWSDVGTGVKFAAFVCR